MRSLATLVCLLGLTGCVSYRASKYTALTGVTAMVAGIVVGISEPNTGETDDHALNGREVAASGLALVGAMVAIAGVIGMVVHGSPTTGPTRGQAVTLSAGSVK